VCIKLVMCTELDRFLYGRGVHRIAGAHRIARTFVRWCAAVFGLTSGCILTMVTALSDTLDITLQNLHTFQ
jgi:hypothetical protein